PHLEFRSSISAFSTTAGRVHRDESMTPTEHVTYCRICEPRCGMVATVDEGRVTKLRPDKDHPLSRGFACPKGIAMTEVHNDPERVLHPQRRRPDGTFERIDWKTALDEIGERLKKVVS